MIKDVVFRFLSREPRTLDALAEETGIPKSLINSCLTSEFYREIKFNHPEVGEVNAWVPNPNCRVRVDTSGVYSLIDNV
jgi:hypothetical protein